MQGEGVPPRTSPTQARAASGIAPGTHPLPVEGLRFGFRVQGLMLRVSGFGSRVLGFGFRI